MGYIPEIVVVGSIMMDLTLFVGRLPLAGESYLGSSYCRCAGGKGANQAVAAARLGAKVSFVGKIGNDADGNLLRKNLSEEGIDVTHLFSQDGVKTGLAAILLEKDGDNRIIANPEANMFLTKKEIADAFEKKADALIIQLETSQESIFEACRIAKEKNIMIILDAGPAQKFPIEELPNIEILTPNETEAAALTGIAIETYADAKRAATKMMKEFAPHYIVIKMGKKGVYFFDGENYEVFERYPVTAVDSTAAGDAFTAAMTYDYLCNRDIRHAIQYGCAAGALAVTKVGAQASLPTKSEMDEFIHTRNIFRSKG